MRRFRMLGGSIHPFYRNILSKAAGLSYEMPSLNCQRLQNNLVVKLSAAPIYGNFWASLDWLYILANDSPDNNFARINWIVTSEVAGGAPVHNIKKGWNGDCQFNHSTSGVGKLHVPGNCSMGFFSTVGGAVTVILETPFGQSGANGSYVIMRHRTTPRVDMISHGTIAGPVAISAAGAVNNTMYFMDNDNSNNRNTNWNNTTLFSSGVGGTGSAPDTGSLAMSGLTSPRITGLIVGGRGISRNHGATDNAPIAFINILRNYMTDVQALP